MKRKKMKTFLLLCVVVICLICWAGAAAQEERTNVQFLKYRNDDELAEIQREIIAQYENLGGSSQFHEEQSATFVDPSKIQINI